MPLVRSHLLPFLGLVVVDSTLGLHVSQVSVPGNLSTRALVRDAYGYSVEPVWVSSFVNNSLMTTLLEEMGNVTGKPPPIRIGGTTSDLTTLHDSLPGDVSSNGTYEFNITNEWFDTFSGYFPQDTDLIFCLNFVDNASSWQNARDTAAVAWNALGSGSGSSANLVMFELGNEIDHYMDKGWRAPGWRVDEYIPQFNNASAGIQQSEWYVDAHEEGQSPPKFQAAVFADPPWVPDQQDEIDDFDIINLTRGGLVDPQHEVIDSYSVHLYPQSTCDTARWYRLRLDLLSNHTTLWLNVSQYIPQVAAADAANTTLVFGETNSASCSGRSGISDTFGAALWSIDYVLMAASIGMPKVYFHLGAQSQYSAFTPLEYTLLNETLAPGIRANFYSHYFIANVVAGLGAGGGEDGEDAEAAYQIAALPGANSSDLSGYAIYRGGEDATKTLAKLVFLDMGVWNGTEGLSNPSTLSSTDGTVFSNGTRPSYNMSVTTPWSVGQDVEVLRLQGPGTNAKSLVNVSGVTFDSTTGAKLGDLATEHATVGEGGVVQFGMVAAEAVLLQTAGESS